MTVDFAYDPVTAMDEATATGETAVLFAEIRQTMRIPLVTSIWRGRAGMRDCLRLAWAAAKPIYESGESERALTRSVAAVGLPRPEPLAPTALACMGLTEDQWTVSLRSRMIVCERPGTSAPSAIAWAVIGTGWCAPPSSTRESIAWS